MTTRYFVTDEGVYIGGYDGVDPPNGAIEVPNAPDDARQIWDFAANEWGVPPPEPAPPVTKRQLRLTLVRNGIPLDAVTAAINAMPDGIAKAEAQIEWEDASYFTRTHPTLLQIAAALNLNETQVDAMWAEAVQA